jgi:preprotein translocase subunit SecF
MNLMSSKQLRYLYFGISLLFLVPGILSLFMFGLKPAIDFTGGSLLEVEIVGQTATNSASVAGITEQVKDVYELSGVQVSGDTNFVLRGKTISNDTKIEVINALDEKFGQVKELRFSSVGPTLGREVLIKMLTAIFLVAGFITIYIWRQFDQLKYGVCAILAMMHDTLILLGTFSVLGKVLAVEVDVLFVTAVLTTLSFSIHDTIVVYDRIRELRRKHRHLDYKQVVNAAVLETLSRSINNSVTIILMLLSLALLGGESIRWFAVALLVGAITGTYSSTFTAAPLLLLWDEFSKKINRK